MKKPAFEGRANSVATTTILAPSCLIVDAAAAHLHLDLLHKKEEKIKQRFTSRDGFWSHYKNELDLWTQDYSEWDHNQIGTCFELFDLEEEDINYSLREYLSETIMDNLGNTLGKEGIDLLDKKQKEKDKKELMDKQQLKLNFN